MPKRKINSNKLDREASREKLLDHLANCSDIYNHDLPSVSDV
ncbi:MAG: hypothetical protein NY202_02095 [Mollicutes bacterium UO1]